jgi:hypothetical protein
MINNDKEKTEQIPGSQDAGETAAVISEQGGIPGQRKEVNVESYANVASIGQILKEFEFPSNKEKIVQFVKTNSISDKDLLNAIERLPDKEYKNVAEVTHEAGLVY